MIMSYKTQDKLDIDEFFYLYLNFFVFCLFKGEECENQVLTVSVG